MAASLTNDVINVEEQHHRRSSAQQTPLARLVVADGKSAWEFTDHSARQQGTFEELRQRTRRGTLEELRQQKHRGALEEQRQQTRAQARRQHERQKQKRAGASCAEQRRQQQLQCRPTPGARSSAPICPLVHTPTETIEAALNLANVDSSDLLLDLGCGDGRVLIAAARRGARAVGLDVQRACLTASRKAAMRAGLNEMIEVLEHDLMRATEAVVYAQATVLYLYLTRKLIVELTPLLLRALHDGKSVLIYCTSGCNLHNGQCQSTTAGNALANLPPAGETMLGMVRLYTPSSLTLGNVSGPAECESGVAAVDAGTVKR